MRPGQREKEVMVWVRRGEGVDYAKKQGSPYLPGGDIHEDFIHDVVNRGDSMTWAAIKAQQTAMLGDILGDSSNEDQFSVERAS